MSFRDIRRDPPLRIPASLYRHPSWVNWKETQGWRRVGDLDGHPVLWRPIGSLSSMAFVAGSPLPGGAGDDYGARLEELSLRAIPFLPAGCAFLRWDLMDEPILDPGGERMADWLLELRMNASTNRRSFRKAANETLCLDTMVVDLRGGWQAVYSRLSPRVRYAVRLADRRGTAVSTEGEAGLGDFYALYRVTQRQRGLRIHPESAFRRLFQSARDQGLKLELYLARVSGEPAASAVIARSGKEAWYLFAASDPGLWHAAGPTAILYRALKDCAEDGFECIDLLGVAPEGMKDHPLKGLSLFKSGFGGTRKSRSGAWDFVLNEEAYADYARFEASRVG